MSETVARAPADGFVSHFPATRFDAILVVSFGGPEGMDDVIPFLENVTRGRNVPRERLEEVAHHYALFGGVSPINAQNRALIAALRVELDAHGIDLPIYFGNRNWDPFLADALREMAEAGVERALAFFTSAFSSYSGCRQYREDIFNAQQTVGPEAPEVVKTRMFFNHPGWIEANAEHVQTALGQLGRGSDVHLAFTAHSIPAAMAQVCRYEDQLRESARLVAEAVGVTDTALVYQSRSGPPQVPWLEPDILDHLRSGRRPRRHGRRRRADRLRLRPSRGAVRSRRRGRRDRRRAGPEPRPCSERGHPSRLRGDDPRTDRGAARSHVRASRRRPIRGEPRHLPDGLLPPGHRPAEPVGCCDARSSPSAERPSSCLPPRGR